MSIDRFLKPGVLILCGSDGVGKTTIAASLAVRAAMREEMRVAVLTIDPARRLANAMGLARLGNRLRPVKLEGARRAGEPRGELHDGEHKPLAAGQHGGDDQRQLQRHQRQQRHHQIDRRWQHHSPG